MLLLLLLQAVPAFAMPCCTAPAMHPRAAAKPDAEAMPPMAHCHTHEAMPSVARQQAKATEGNDAAQPGPLASCPMRHNVAAAVPLLANRADAVANRPVLLTASLLPSIAETAKPLHVSPLPDRSLPGPDLPLRV